MKIAKKKFIAVLALMLAGCASPNIKLQQVEFIGEETKVEVIGSDVLVEGYLQIEISSDQELYAFADNGSYQVRHRIRLCNSSKWLSAYPYLLLLEDRLSPPFRYIVLLDYKYDESVAGFDPSSNLFEKYNLAENTSPICLNVYMGDMLPLNSRRENTVRFLVSEELQDELRKYDHNSGKLVWKKINEKPLPEWWN